MDRPPPYFPQNPLSPQNENKYKKFKLIAASAVVALTLILIGLGAGIYYLLRWAFS